MRNALRKTVTCVSARKRAVVMEDVKGQRKPDDVLTKDLGKDRQGSRVRPSWDRPAPPVVEKSVHLKWWKGTCVLD